MIVETQRTLKSLIFVLSSLIIIFSTHLQVTAGSPQDNKEIFNKINTIIIDSVQFEEFPVDKALHTLSIRSKELDKDKKGVPIKYKVSNGDIPKVTLIIQNISLKEAISNICIDGGLKYELRENGIVVSKKDKNEPVSKIDNNLKKSNKKIEKIAKKLDEIKISIEIDDASIIGVLQYLNTLSRVHDKEKQGVGIYLKLKPEQLKETKRFTFKAKNISLKKVVEKLCEDTGLHYIIVENAVIIYK